MTELIDIGANLTHRSFGADLAEVLERAKRAGVAAMVVTGLSEDVSRRAAELAAARPGTLYSTAGVHPHNTRGCGPDTVATLKDISARDSVVAIGECGLDYDRNFSAPSVQREWFDTQLRLAVELQRPVFLHERDAHDDFVAILSRHRDALPGGVVHCFTGGAAELDVYLELDLHIGITGWICDERRGSRLLEIVDRIPRDRLMIETDAPFLLPRTIRPRPKKRRNEPAYLPHVLHAVASAVGRPSDEVAAETSAVARRFFGLSAQRAQPG